MKLADWLTTNGVSDAAFAVRIGVTRQTVGRYKTGERRPEWDVLQRILDETESAVTPNDFLDESEVMA